MASLLHCCFQNIETISLKTIKNSIPISHKDFRITKIGDFFSSGYGIMSKIELKVTKVDPKKTKKRPIYVIKLFFARFRMVRPYAIT